MTPSISLILADDHALIRTAIINLLAGHHDIRVVAQANSGAEVPSLVTRLRPDIVLLDLAMPGVGGLETLRLLKGLGATPRVIALSSQTGEKWVMRALRGGVRGYVLKTETADNLALAIRTVHRGGTWFSKEVAALISALALEPTIGTDPLERLSPRQRLVLQLIAEGQTNKDIARTLNLSESTVDSHRTQLMRRLDVHDIAGLVRLAIREGVISVD